RSHYVRAYTGIASMPAGQVLSTSQSSFPAATNMPLYWLCYRHDNQISVVIEPGASLIHARLQLDTSFLARPCRTEASRTYGTCIPHVWKPLDAIYHHLHHLLIFDRSRNTDFTSPSHLFPSGNDVSRAKTCIATGYIVLAHAKHNLRLIKHCADELGLC